MIRTFHDFIADRSGNFAMMTVIMLVPLLAAVGMAVDYASIGRTDSRLQAAVDAAVLFAGRYYEKHEKMPNRRDVRRFLRANFDGRVYDIKIKRVGDEIRVDAETTAPGYFLANAMPDSFQRRAGATVPINSGTDLELVMVLDSTYSMSAENKMVDLKRVAKDFVDQIEENAGRNDVRIGLVPFTNHVNVGVHRRKARWLDVPPDEEKTEYSCQMEAQYKYSNCRTEVRYRDGVPYDAKICDRRKVGEKKVCKNRTTRVTWRGCVGSRPKPHTLKDDGIRPRFQGLMNVNCGRELKPLTGNFRDLKKAIDAMYPTQDTYIAPGVMWGLRLLSPHAPFKQAKKASSKRRKIMVIMTDGDNQRSANLPWSPANWGKDLVQADEWSVQACKEAKDNDVVIYTIAFGKSVSRSGKDVMRACASDADGYYESRDADALKRAFEDIGRKISTLRLTS